MAFRNVGIKSSLAAALAIAALASGCGGGSNSETSSLTKAQFIKRGDAICQRADNQRQLLLEKWVEDHSTESLTTKNGEAAMIKASAIPSLQAEVDGLTALGAPSGDEELINSITRGLEEAIQRIEDDPTGLASYQAAAFNQIDATARKYGFKVCAELL